MKSTWIGLVNVIPCSDGSALSRGAKGAFVNALAPASDSSEYERVVEAALSELNVKAVAFESVETFRDRLDKESLSEELYTLAKQVDETGTAAFSSFHNYFGED